MGNKQTKKSSDAANAKLLDPPRSGVTGPAGQTSQTAFDQYAFPFENAVFEGGLRNLLPYVGAVRLLEEAGIWRNIIRLAGSGSGAVIATLLTLGYNSHQLEKFFQDDLRILTQASAPDKPPNEQGACASCCLGYQLKSNYGLNPNKKILKWLGEKISTSAGMANISFLQAYEKFGKELCIVVTNVSQGHVEYFHRKTTPNLTIMSAVRMSMATPGLIGPIQVALHGESPQIFADGGILCNYPIHCYDGWWLSTKPEDSFVTKVAGLEDLPSALDLQNRFARFNAKTIGFVVYDDTPFDSWTAKLEARNKLGDKVVNPETLLSKTHYYDVHTNRRTRQNEYKQYAAAANKLLNALADRVPDVNKLMDTSELDAVLNKTSVITSNEVRILFGTKSSAGDICKQLAPNKKGQISRQDILNSFESKASSMEALYRNQSRCKIANLTDYLEAVNRAESLNSRYQTATTEDLDRTVGINIHHLTGLRNEKLAPADITFMIEQGKLSTRAFLENFVSRGATPIKDSPNRRSFCRDDLPSFIDDDVSEIIDERDYMENLIGRVL